MGKIGTSVLKGAKEALEYAIKELEATPENELATRQEIEAIMDWESDEDQELVGRDEIGI